MPARIVSILVLALFIACTWGCSKKEQANNNIDETYTLGAEDKRAFGAYAFRYLSNFAFVDNEVSTNAKAFDKWHSELMSYDEDRTGNTYILVSPSLPAYKDEVIAMTDFVERGNTLFVAADYFDPYFLEMFNLSQTRELNFLSPPSAFAARPTFKQLADTTTFYPSSFSFFCYPMFYTLETDSTKKFEVLSYNDYGKPDAMRLLYGKGELIIATNATAFSNYFLLSNDNYKYGLDMLSYLPVYNKQVVWDDFYRRYAQRSRPPEGQSMFSALFSIPQMKWAFWILVAIMLLWFATNLARKQRIIPVTIPNSNSSAEFTQTIARLYFNKKDNHNIALKMIAYFQDHVRSKYYMNYTGVNEEFANTLATKTGLPPAKTQALIQSISNVQKNTSTSDEALLRLNEQIQEVLNLTQAKN